MTDAETKTITGVCSEISERGEWTTFHIDGGGQYPVKLATKLSPLIELGRATSKSGELATWTYSERESEKINEHTGKPFLNRYLEKVEVGGSADPTPEADEPAAKAGPHHSPLIAGDKDRAITRMACLKAAAEIISQTPSSDDPALETMKAAARFETWVYRDLDEPPFS